MPHIPTRAVSWPGCQWCSWPLPLPCSSTAAMTSQPGGTSVSTPSEYVCVYTCTFLFSVLFFLLLSFLLKFYISILLHKSTIFVFILFKGSDCHEIHFVGKLRLYFVVTMDRAPGVQCYGRCVLAPALNARFDNKLNKPVHCALSPPR